MPEPPRRPRPEVSDPSAIVEILFGIEGAVVLSVVDDADADGEALGILIEMPRAEVRCPTCGGAVAEAARVLDELPATRAGPVPVLIVWKRRRWRCADPSCRQQIFEEESPAIDRALDRDGPGRRSRPLRRLRQD